MVEIFRPHDRMLASAVRRIRASAELSPVNRRLLLAYVDEMISQGLSKGRVYRLTQYLVQLARWVGGDFPDADLAAIKRAVARIETSPYVPYSKKVYKLVLRRFYKWLRGTEEYPPEVKWIPMRMQKAHRIRLPEELLSEADVQAMTDAALTPRDRAFVAVLYESGARIGEFATRRLRHVAFDQYGARLLLDGKTGRRSVRVVASVPLLKAWVNVHPRRGEPSAYLWPSNQGGFLGSNAIHSLLLRLAQRGGVKKSINPYLFRHSRATHLASFLTEAQMKVHFGWVQDSDMAAVYVHLSGRDVDDALLKLHGLKKDEHGAGQNLLTPKRCLQCSTDNPAGNHFCSLCGLALDSKAQHTIVERDAQRSEADDVLDEMLMDPNFREQFKRRLGDVTRRAPGRPPKRASRAA